jgi:hypothetical protein
MVTGGGAEGLAMTQRDHLMVIEALQRRITWQ